MSATAGWEHPVPYLPFLTAPPTAPQELPDYVRPQVRRDRILAVPGPLATADPLSVLRLYLGDLDWVILPEAHRDPDGYTFANLSWYSVDERPRAFCEQAGDLCRCELSIGLVRVLAALAHAVWRVVVPMMSDRPAPAAVPGAPDLATVMASGEPPPAEVATAVLRRYPRALGCNPDLDGGYENEYLLFADMLRFAWCHEWFHGLAGHAALLRDRYGLSEVGETGPARPGPADPAALRRAMEVQADALSLDLLLDQIFMGEDLPTNLVDLDTDLGGRLGVLVLAFCTLTAYWAAQERDSPLPDRRHPSAGLRYLRTWDELRRRLLIVGDRRALAGLTAIGSCVFRLAETFPAFAGFATVTPVLTDTPSMRALRAELADYRRLLAGIRDDLRPFVLDHAFRDAYGVPGPDTGPGDDAAAVRRDGENLAYWLQIPDADRERVAAHYPGLFAEHTRQLLAVLVEHYRAAGDAATCARLEEAGRVLDGLRAAGPGRFARDWQLLGVTGPAASRLADWAVRGLLADGADRPDRPDCPDRPDRTGRERADDDPATAG